jgi:hypothetical protein
LYESLDLTFRPAGSGSYRVYATCPLAGDASGAFRPPGIEQGGHPAGARDLAAAGAATTADRGPQAIGGELFDGVFAGQVLQCLQESAERARSRGLGLRIRLRLRRCPQLSSLPWELLLAHQAGAPPAVLGERVCDL